MSRFLKGTTDHDNDGHKGGSMKGDTTMAKKPTKAKAAKPASKKVQADDLPETKPTKAAKKAAAENVFAKADAEAAPVTSEADDVRMTMAAKGGL